MCRPSEPESDNNQAQRVLTTLKRKLEGIEEGVVLGVEGQINHLIRKAQDPANLSRIFVGWQPWI
jgi:ataxia telangiectasia mutated family protein